MIRMAFMTDAANVIGASTPEANERRFKSLPKQLPEAMGALYQTPNIAVGSASFATFIKGSEKTYVISNDSNYQLPEERKDAIVETDINALINKYKDSDDELLVVGGRTIFKLFLPHARVLDVALSDELVEGDVVFEGWNEAGFHLVNDVAWEGFRVQRFEK